MKNILKDFLAVAEVFLFKKSKEFHYFAMELARKFVPIFSVESIAFFEAILLKKAWRDSVMFGFLLFWENYFYGFQKRSFQNHLPALIKRETLKRIIVN